MGQMTRKVSMQDLADYLKISKNAVSLALNDKKGVSEELRKMVVKAAQDLGYGSYASRDNKSGSNNILVLTPEYISYDKFFYNNVYWSMIIEKEAKERGYNAILTSVSAELEKKLLMPSIYFDIEFKGIMIIGIFTDEYVKKLISTNLPVLSVDHCYDDIPLDAVVTANEEGAYKAVKYLIDNGHTDIGYVGSIKVTSSLYERWCGYNKAMLLHELKINEEHCILETSPLKILFSDPDELEQYIAKMKSFPTAWLCGGDRIAIALINVLTRRGIKVPDDISVVGFDDIEVSSIIVPPLTTLRVRRDHMGIKAVDFLINRIMEGGDVKQRIGIYGDLVVRETVKKLN